MNCLLCGLKRHPSLRINAIVLTPHESIADQSGSEPTSEQICRYEAVNTSVVSQHDRERQRRCVSPPVVKNEQPRGGSMQIQFQQRVNSLYWAALIKLPRLFVYSELHANTMQIQKNQHRMQV